MGPAVLAGLVGLILTATALGLAAVRVDRQVRATAATAERIRLLRLAATTLRADAAATRSRLDGATDSVRHLGRR